MTEKQKHTEHIPKEITELVITRIDVQAPSTLRLSIGSYGSFTKEEMIEHVRKGDEVGRHIIKSHLAFMKAIAMGHVSQALASVSDD